MKFAITNFPWQIPCWIIVLARLRPSENTSAHGWGHGDTSGYLAMVWEPQCRAGLQHHSGGTSGSEHTDWGTTGLEWHWAADVDAWSGPWTRWQQCHPCTEGLELSAGTGTELKSICRWGKGKPLSQAFCKTEPAAPHSTGYNKSEVTASHFPSFKYRQAHRIHRIRQEGLWLCGPAVGRDRSALAWLIP